MKLRSVKELDKKYIVQSYGKYDLCLTEGRGCRVWDTEGNEYLDLLGGIAVNVLGHAHPRLSHAISEQAKKLIHVSNLYYIEEQAELAKLLSDLSPLEGAKAFFCNSGAEANEAAIKFARKHTGRHGIIAMKGSFHGRTMGSIAITGSHREKYQKPFEPVMPDVRFADYGDLKDLKDNISNDVAAVFVECIQGEGGIRMAGWDKEGTWEYLNGVRDLCSRNGALMVVDEVQTGNGRTGKFFACQHFGIKPDIITMAKGIAGGVPMGVTLVSADVANSIHPGDHASTFGGNPLACEASKAVVDTILEEGLMENAEKMGKYLMDGIKAISSKHVREVRGLGLMVGVELESQETAKKVKEKMQGRGFLLNVTSETVLRFVPPLIITQADIDSTVENLKEVLKDV